MVRRKKSDTHRHALPVSMNMENDSVVKCIVANARSVNSKSDRLYMDLIENNTDLLMITETWINTDEDRIRLQGSALNINNYCVSHFDRERRGWGVALVYRNGATVKIITSGRRSSFEFCLWEVKIRNVTQIIMVVYRPPTGSKDGSSITAAVDDFCECLSSILPSHQNIIICGDFNIHVNDQSNNEAMSFIETMSALGFKQLVNFPTHKDHHTLDLVFVEDIEGKAITYECYAGSFISDHRMVFLNINTRDVHTVRPQKNVSFRKLKNINISLFKKDLKEKISSLEWTDNLDQDWSLYEQCLHEVLDKHAPEKTIRCIVRKKVPWYTEAVKNQKRIVRNREKIWKRYDEDHQWKAFTIERNKLNRLLQEEKVLHHVNIIQQCGQDSKKLYKAMYQITGTKCENTIPDTNLSNKELTEEFANFFMAKIMKIRDNLQHVPLYDPEERNIFTFRAFESVTHEEVKRAIIDLATKTL